MATTTNRGLTKPVSEQDAQKVATYNTLADENDAADAGYIAISDDTSNALTRTQALNVFLKFTATLTANRTRSIPATGGFNRVYVIWNATSGAFTLGIKIGSGTALTITQGKAVILFHDGTTCYAFPEFTPSTSPIAGIDNAAWDAWTPTWTNLSVGNGTVVALFKQIGKTIFCRLSIVFGSTTSISGSVSVSLPVTRAANAGSAALTWQGVGRCLDSSAGSKYDGAIINLTTTTVAINIYDASGTYLTQANLSSTVPFTWATSDEITMQFFYEAA